MRDFGRVRRGDAAALSVRLPARPDGAPVAVIMDAEDTILGTPFMNPVDYSGLVFQIGAFIDSDYAIGNFRVYFHYVIGGTAAVQSGSFEVIPGGDSGGAVIS